MRMRLVQDGQLPQRNSAVVRKKIGFEQTTRRLGIRRYTLQIIGSHCQFQRGTWGIHNFKIKVEGRTHWVGRKSRPENAITSQWKGIYLKEITKKWLTKISQCYVDTGCQKQNRGLCPGSCKRNITKQSQPMESVK